MADITGTGVALVTPFKEDYSIDYESLKSLIEHTTSGGVDYLVIMGTTAETATVSKKEKAEVLSFVKQNNRNNLPIVYGIGGNNTQEVIEEIKNSDLEGVIAILSVAPYYNKPSQEGLFLHYMAIADNSPVPIILYNVPGRTGMNLNAKTVARLSVHPNIIGVKEASGDLIQCMEIVKNTDEEFLLIAGDDLLAVPIISIGGVGSIAVLSNLYPRELTTMVNSALRGDYITANQMLHKFTELNPLLYKEGNPVGAKAALAMMGLIKNVVRLPLATASLSLQDEIKNALII